MALQATCETVFGTLKEAYCRLSAINWYEGSPDIEIKLNVYLSESALKVEHRPPLDARIFKIPLTSVLGAGENVIAFAYGFIRENDPEMAKATNV